MEAGREGAPEGGWEVVCVDLAYNYSTLEVKAKEL